MNQKVAVRMLEKMGYRVDVVANGAQAIEAVRQGDYQLVLMDCQMPGLDGFEATAAIRAMNDARSNIPIVALTASAMKGDLERCLAAGMNDTISKPMLPKDIDRVLQRIS